MPSSLKEQGLHADAARRRISHFAFVFLFALTSAGADSPPREITIVTDISYPPYLFATDDGELHGVIKDKWERWSQKTGVPVHIVGMTWVKAQQAVQNGTADVIDALAFTRERTQLYEFSPPYAPVEAHVYFHHSISGVGDVSTMRGFTIGAKEGSACGRWLMDRGIETRGYATSESLVRAAGAGDVRLFCMDSMTAQYYLFKSGIAADFRASPPLYFTHFHWAVKKGNRALFEFIQSGFERFTSKELAEIDSHWIGNPVTYPLAKRFTYYLAILVAVVLLAYVVLIIWNHVLRTRVAARTAELRDALSSLQNQKQALELIAQGAPLERSLDTLLRVIEAQSPGMLCSILLVDDDGLHVRHAAAPSLPAEFIDAINGEPIGERAGSCGTAVYRRESVIVENIATDPLWDTYRVVALSHGLRACWSTPIIDGQGRVLGTFAMYFREPGRPDEQHRRLIAAVTHTATIAISRQREHEALQRSEERLRLAVTGANLATLHWDVVSDEFSLSSAGYAMLQLAPGPLSLEKFLAAIHPQDGTQAESALRRALIERGSFEFECRGVDPGGVERWISVRGQGYCDAAGRPLRVEGIAADITASKLAEQKVARLNRVYAMLSGINSLIVRMHDWRELFNESCRLAVVAGKFRMAWIGILDREMGRMQLVASHGAEEAFFQHLDRVAEQDAGDASGMMWRAVNEKRATVSNDIEHDAQVILARDTLLARGMRSVAVLPLMVGDEVSGVLVLYASEAGVFDDDEMELLNEVAGDIAFGLDHIRKEERINYLAYYDALTGLANRALFHERLTQYLHAAERDNGSLALCVVDLDHFKNVNDALGRQAGDTLLAQFARRLTESAGDTDRIARLGADRFAMVLPDVAGERDVLRWIDEAMTHCTGQPFQLADTELRIAAKIGIASYVAASDADMLFRNAEAALKQAKMGGERYLFYTEAMTQHIAEKVSLESRLRRALEREEFVLFYQAKVNASNRRVTGLEALIRWNDPHSGMVLPMKFVPLLEETGMILDVGTWAIQRAIYDHAFWHAQKILAPRIAVNVSAVQLRQHDFVSIVRAALTRGESSALDLEITESLVMTDVEANIDKFRELHRLGVDIAIDDFGTGYSSLGYLARLPVQVLKIDVTFIARMLKDPATLTLVTTMISLAHSLGLKVVAEGVETEEQARALTQLRCDELQGYLISRPLPRDKMTEFLSKMR